MIRRLFDDLKATEIYDVDHLRFNFSPNFGNLRKFSFRKVIELLRVFLRIGLIRIRGPIDILWYPSGGPQTAPILRDIILIPIVSSLCRHTVVHFHAAGIAERLKQKSNSLLSCLAAKIFNVFADAAIVMTEYNRRDPDALGIEPVYVIPHQIDDRWDSTTTHRATSGRYDFLYVGHLYDLKGTPQLLRAFATASASQPKTRLTLVGGFIAPYCEEQLRSELETLGLTGRVQYAGEVRGTEVDRFYAHADCFIFPTIAPYESFGMVLLEAMMWQLPVVATDWRGNRDVLGGQAGGIVFDPGDDLVPALAAAIQMACEHRHEWSQWGALNRQRFLRHFRNTNANRYAELIDHTCEGHR